jgi:hypothetical protein
LYAAVVDGSPYTFDRVVRVLELCALNGIRLPPIATFARSHIDEAHGWGRSVPRSFFRDAELNHEGDR